MLLSVISVPNALRDEPAGTTLNGFCQPGIAPLAEPVASSRLNQIFCAYSIRVRKACASNKLDLMKNHQRQIVEHG
jgi:hypothetical protein